MLITGALIIDEKIRKVASIRLQNGLIMQIAQNLKPQKNETVINAEGLWLLPGAVDLNVGLGEGAQIAPTLDKLRKSALKGGVTTIALMPDVAVNSEVGYDYFAQKAIGEPSIKIVASSTEHNAGEKLNNLSSVFHEGAIGVHSPSDLSPDYLRCVSRYAAMQNKTWFVRAQNKTLDASAGMHEGKTAFSLGLTGFSRLGESSEIAKICEYARDANTSVVIESISSKEGLNAGLRAKKSGAKVYLQTALPYLTLDDSSCLGFNSYAKIYPPLREPSDKEALLSACISGVIDVIASAHRSISSAKKEVSFDEALFGMESIAEFWSLVFTALEGKTSIQKICALVASSPAKILGLNDRGKIKVGMRADLVLFDPVHESIPDITSKKPLERIMLKGKVIKTISAEVSVW